LHRLEFAEAGFFAGAKEEVERVEGDDAVVGVDDVDAGFFLAADLGVEGSLRRVVGGLASRDAGVGPIARFTT
jgi:hypothetical protein